jgi:hypothetical protein
MALSWDITKCADIQLLQSGTEWNKTEGIIFSTMSIDMHTITEENAIEFYARLKLLSTVYNGFFYDKETNQYVEPTFEDVQIRIGLHTNAYSKNTFNQWLKRIEKVHGKDISKNKMLAAYYSAKAEIEQLMEEKATHTERNESFAFDLQPRSGA